MLSMISWQKIGDQITYCWIFVSTFLLFLGWWSLEMLFMISLHMPGDHVTVYFFRHDCFNFNSSLSCNQCSCYQWVNDQQACCNWSAKHTYLFIYLFILTIVERCWQSHFSGTKQLVLAYKNLIAVTDYMCCKYSQSEDL